MSAYTELRRIKAATPVAPPVNLYTALAKARGEFPAIPKRRVATVRMKNGGQYSYKYADLADIFDAVTPAMSAYGLGVKQFPTREGVVTVVYHESGEADVSEPYPILPMPQRSLEDCQSYQSAFQVAKRYSLQAALGISTEDSIEGDRSKEISKQSATFVSEGMKDAWRDSVLDSLPENASPEEKAQAFANAIIREASEKKSIKGMDGVWARREPYIDKIEARHEVIYQNLFEEFHAIRNQLLAEKGDE